MTELIKELDRLTATQNFGALDYSILERHIEILSLLDKATSTAVTIYDNCRRETVYRSRGYIELYGDNENNIHPDDLTDVLRSGVIAMRYFFDGNKNAVNHRLIRKYRAKVKNEYRVIIEQMQPLELDCNGKVWLSVDFVDVSPNQSLPSKVEFKIFNIRTGDIITPVDEFMDGQSILTERETDVLRLIDSGLLSKEISERLGISVHTVNTHRQRILEKLKVGTSIEAIKYAAAMGIL